MLPGASGAILEERQGGLCHHHHWEGAERPADSLRLWWDEMHSDYSQQNDGNSQ